MSFNQQPPRLIAYWLGYRSQDHAANTTPTLQEIPDCVDVVVLAFALVRPGNVIDTRFMYEPPNTEGSILEGVKVLKQRGKKVLLSVGGWGGNCWKNVTSVPALADSIMGVVERWGLDGVDLDDEGDNPLDDWMRLPACPYHSGPGMDLAALIRELRSRLGQDRILTVVTAGGGYDAGTIQELNWVSTMDYGGTGGYDAMVDQYRTTYPDAQVLPFSLGVSCADPEMDIGQVEAICRHEPPLGPLRMMLWDLSEDNEGFTGKPLWSYVKTIDANLPK